MTNLLKQGTERTTGKEAQHNNFQAAKDISALVASTLGPMGSDKLIVDPVGNITVTNDGVTILKEMQIDHPAARMIVEISKTQEEEIGDGTTSCVILAGEFIKKAEELMGKGIHASAIIRGYRKAEQKSQQVLQQLATTITVNDTAILKNIACTAMIGKGAEGNREYLADLLVNAIGTNYLHNGGKAVRNEIKISGAEGSSVEKSFKIEGLVVEKEKCHPSMPNGFEQATIFLISSPMRIKSQDNEGENLLSEHIKWLVKENINVVFCERDIDDYFISHFIEKGIMAIKWVHRNDMELLSKITGARIYNAIPHTPVVGKAKVGERQEGKGRFIFVEGHGSIHTLFVRGATPHLVEEIQRSLTDAVGDVCSAINEGKVVGGAGAIEIKLARELRKYASQLQGKEQLIILAYSEAIESIPTVLAENSGLDSIELITTLRTKTGWEGINVFTGEIQDSFKMGVVEPLKIKTQAISSATEVAEMILRIDDCVLGKRQTIEEK